MRFDWIYAFDGSDELLKELWGAPAYPPFVYVISNMSPELSVLQKTKGFARRKTRRTF